VTYFISDDTPAQVEDAKEFVKEAVEELDSNEIEAPIDTDADDLIDECLSNMGAFDEVADNVRFEDSGFESVSEEVFRYPLITRMSRGFKIADDSKQEIHDTLDELDINIEFARRYWLVQQSPDSGVFTTISSQTESHHRLIYPKAREAGLSEEEIGELLLELEEKMTRGRLMELEIDEKIEEIQTKE
jgi:hypothetical protein